VSAASQVPAVIDYLVATCQASPAFGPVPVAGAIAPVPVVVTDGPNVTEDVMANQRLLWIGYDRTNPGEVSGTTALDWPNLDMARTVDEDGEITCSAEFWSGDTTVKTNRDGCAAIVTAVSELLKGTPVTGGPGDTTMGGLCFWSRVSASAWAQQQKSTGATVLCVFKIAYRARLTD